MTNYIVAVYTAEGRVDMRAVEESELWSNENPDGLTYQDMFGPHGTLVYDGDSYEEANKIYNSYREQFE